MRTFAFVISFAALGAAIFAFLKSRSMPSASRLSVRIFICGPLVWLAVIMAIVGHFLP